LPQRELDEALACLMDLLSIQFNSKAQPQHSLFA